MDYVERKKRNIRSIRAQMKKTIKELKRALAEGADSDIREMEEELMKLAKSKRELSQRVRFRL
ncbi:MAG: hypothetical protein ACXQTI_09400 [Candidatus Nezhaarchaeales archaeon]